jgi:hypothetical protein
MIWKGMEELVRDGRQVLFWSPAGAFVAPAFEAPTGDRLRATQRQIYEATGQWPSNDFSPVKWAEIDPPETTENTR